LYTINLFLGRNMTRVAQDPIVSNWAKAKATGGKTNVETPNRSRCRYDLYEGDPGRKHGATRKGVDQTVGTVQED